MAEVLARLGNIAPERIVLPPHEGPATEEDILYWEEQPTKRICELVNGVLVEKPMGYSEDLLNVFLICRINEFVVAHDLGSVAGPTGMARLFPGRVRVPDVAVTLWERLPNEQVPIVKITPIVPHLVVEVLSESNTAQEMEIKRAEYFRTGVLLVWEVDPELRQVAVYTSPHDVTRRLVGDMLDGGAVLPGFSLPVADIFNQLGRKRRPNP